MDRHVATELSGHIAFQGSDAVVGGDKRVLRDHDFALHYTYRLAKRPTTFFQESLCGQQRIRFIQ
ncbi:hypothetical protein [Streptomyces olivaceus]|uniref:hypothetical protein n=1 Tax=Streptomyces olivaceus TaxID=47716 RepID=UPI0033B38E66